MSKQIKARNLLRHTSFLLVIVGVALALALTGCAAAPTPAPTAAPAPTPAPTATPAPAPTPTETGRPAGVPAPGESVALDRVYEDGVLRGGCAPTPPHCMIDPATNEWVGTGPELAKELARRLGVDYETVGTGWDGIVPGLPAGKYDIIITGLTYRPERDEVVDFVIMGEYGFCLLARADDDRVQNWDSFVNDPDMVLCETQGTAEEQMILSEYPTINLRSMGADTVALWEEVLANRCDADLVGSISVPIYVEITEGKLKVAPQDCLDFPIFGKEWGHAVDEGDTAFYNWLQTTINELEESGWLDDLYDLWMQPEKLRMGLEVE